MICNFSAKGKFCIGSAHFTEHVQFADNLWFGRQNSHVDCSHQSIRYSVHGFDRICRTAQRNALRSLRIRRRDRFGIHNSK